MNLWILSEEYPRVQTLNTIIKMFLKDNNFSSFIDNIRVIPMLENNSFNFTYKVIGINCNKIKNIFIKIVKGSSSFVDYLIFYQNDEPTHTDNPIYAIEETKTDDKESRNTSIYQRAIKFIFIDAYYKNVKKVMLHQRKNINRQFTDTYIFGVRLLKTFNVYFTDEETNKIEAFSNIDDLITFKNNMRKIEKIGKIERIYPKEPEKIYSNFKETSMDVSIPSFVIGIKDNLEKENIVKKELILNILLNYLLDENSKLYK